MKLFTTTLVLALLHSGSVFAAGVPNTINYQGRLTDAAGGAVPDGPILVKFQIYDAATDGAVLWNSLFQTINTVDGMFSYDMGSNVPLPDLYGTDSIRYLGITVGTDPEISPRSRFTSSGYVFRSLHSDSARYSTFAMTAGLADDAEAFAGETPDFYLNWGDMTNVPAGFADGVDDEGISQVDAEARYLVQFGDTLQGDLVFDGNNDGIGGGRIEVLLDAANLELGAGGQEKSKLWGQSYGELDLRTENGVNGAFLAANNSWGGRLQLKDSAGASTIALVGNFGGDASVIIPNDAINSSEMLDEPGIAGDLNSTTTITLNQTTIVMVDLAATTITIPSTGYILLWGHTTQYTSSTTGTNIGIYQIDEIAGGTRNESYYTWAGHNVSPNTNTFYQSVEANRVYFKNAGTYTFRLEAVAFSSNDATATTQCYGSKIIAMYFPTSYGSVTTVAGHQGDHPDAKAVTVTGLDGRTSTGYKMDLRYYEEKARAARMTKQKAELAEAKAELELIRARATSDRN